MRKKPLFKTSAPRFILINAIIALIISLFYVDEFQFTAKWITEFLIQIFFFAFLISCLLSGGISRLILFSSQNYSWLNDTLKRLSMDIFVVIIYTFIVYTVLSVLFSLFVWHIYTWETLDWSAIFRASTGVVIISLIISIVFTSISFLKEWKETAIEVEQMKTERLAGQYQSLKDQLNPHFLFNSLNVLSSLIYEDQELAETFVERLSKIYRYVLEVQDEELVDLKRELDFSRSYLELQKLRFDEKLDFQIASLDEKGKQLPPLSLQLLLENVVKHNSGTREKPLRIKIYGKNNLIIVQNNIQPRLQTKPKSGIGLENIRQRLSYLTDQPLEVKSENGIFSVGIPLINQKS